MSIVTFSLLVVALSLVLLVAPVGVALYTTGTSVLRSIFSLLLQFVPVVSSATYFQYAESHARIPIFSFARPGIYPVFGVIAALQALATIVALWGLRLAFKEMCLCIAMSVTGAVGIAFIVQGVVACINGNCF